MTDRAWLVAIDLQRVFGDPTSEWRAPRYAAAEANVVRLAEAFAERSVFTRFVAPERPSGAWTSYYEQFPWALAPADSELYAFPQGVAAYTQRTVVAPTFGKWGQLRTIVSEPPQLVVAGVATDCCVISTVLAAADAGASILVVTDACAGSTDANHTKALDIMSLYAPLVSLTTTDEVLGSRLA